jgi:hypothetical protein
MQGRPEVGISGARIDSGGMMGNSTRGAARKSRLLISNDISGEAPGRLLTVEAPDPRARAEIAGYIAQLTAEMSSMAEKAGLETLAYFLSMARLEAEMNRRQSPDL